VLGLISCASADSRFFEVQAKYQARARRLEDIEKLTTGEGVLYLPEQARFPPAQTGRGGQPGARAQRRHERHRGENDDLKGVLPRSTTRGRKLGAGELLRLLAPCGSRRRLRQVYEYFLGTSPSRKARRAACSTPTSIVS